MAQNLRTRRQGSISVTGFSTKYVQPLGRGMLYRSLLVSLVGTFTYAAAGNNAAATLGRGDEWSAIEKIEVIANGVDTIRSFSGTNLRMLNQLWFNSKVRPSPQMGDGTTAAPAYSSVLEIPFYQPRAYSGMDTVLNSNLLADLRIEITTAASAGINTANGPTAINATMDIHSIESFGAVGQFSDLRIYTIQTQSPGANPNFQVSLPVTALYRGFLINAANGAGATATDLPTAITSVQLVSGTTIYRDMTWQVMRDYYRTTKDINRELVQAVAATTPISGTYLNDGKSTLQLGDAWCFFDLCYDGYLGESVDSVGLSELYLNFNLAAASTLTILPIQIFPVRKSA